MPRKMSKPLLDVAYEYVEEWAGQINSPASPIRLLEALRQYDPDRFFKAYQAGYEKALKARVASGEKYSTKEGE